MRDRQLPRFGISVAIGLPEPWDTGAEVTPDRWGSDVPRQSGWRHWQRQRATELLAGSAVRWPPRPGWSCRQHQAPRNPERTRLTFRTRPVQTPMHGRVATPPKIGRAHV